MRWAALELVFESLLYSGVALLVASRVRNPARRHRVISGALLGLLLLPLANLHGGWRVGSLHDRARAAIDAPPSVVDGLEAKGRADPAAGQIYGGSHTISPPGYGGGRDDRHPGVLGGGVPGDVLLLIYIVGMAAFLVIPTAGLLRIARLRRVGDVPPETVLGEVRLLAAQVGLQRPVEVRIIDAVPGPCVTGWIRPTVLLPPYVLRWSPERRSLALAHELQHIVRGDLPLLLVAGLARAVHWFNPIVHRLADGSMRAAEEAVDDAVLAGGVSPREYGSMLVAAAAERITPSLGTAPAAVGSLRSRLSRLRTAPAPRGDAGGSSGISSTGALMATVFLPWVALACAETVPVPRAERWSLEEEQRIGSLAEEGTALTEVGSIAVDPEGKLYVRQLSEGLVRRFDEDGSPAGVFGGVGDGPGEFRSPWAAGLHGDTLWISDLRTLKTARFGTGGGLLGAVTVSPSTRRELGGHLRPLGLLRSGRLALVRVPAADETAATARVVAVDPGTEEVIRLAEIRHESGDLRAVSSAGPVVLAAPVDAASLVALAPDGRSVVVVHRPPSEDAAPDSLRVLRIGERGDTLFDRHVRYDPVRLPAEVVDSIRGFWIRELSEFIPRSEAAQILQGLNLPRFLPPVSKLVVGLDRRVWLRREELVGSTAVWMVLGPDGGHEATLELPTDVDLHAADRDRAWGSVTDSLGVPYVVRFRVARSG